MLRLDFYDVDKLFESLELVKFNKPSDRKAHPGAFHHGYRRNVQRNVNDAFGWVFEDFDPIDISWVSHIDPGGDIPPHKDASPWLERWQIPIQPAGTFIIDGEEVEQIAGVPFQVQHWTFHHVTNDTDRARIHLIIDRDVVAHEGKGEFVDGGSPSDTT